MHYINRKCLSRLPQHQGARSEVAISEISDLDLEWTHYDDYSARLEVAADSSVIADALAAKSDHPSDHCEFGEHGWLNEDVNVLTGIMNFTARVMAGEG